MRKRDAVEKLDQAGSAIQNLNASAWNTALNPERHGWGRSLLSVAALPVLGAATIGHLVGSVVVKKIPEGAFEKLPGSGRP